MCTSSIAIDKNQTTENGTAATVTAAAAGSAGTTKIKENFGSVSMKLSTERKSSAKLNNKPAKISHDIFDDGIEFSEDDGKFYGFTSDDINKCSDWGNWKFC